MRSALRYHIKDRFFLAYSKYLLGKSNGRTPILVLTMAKVGSSSVYFSIKKSSNVPVFHIHSLDEHEIKNGIKSCFDRGIYPGHRTPVFLINKEIMAKKRAHKIVVLFRNPIERNMSAFFDAFKFHLGVPPENYTGTFEQLVKKYHEKLSHTYAIDWFDKQFFDATSLNIYDIPFHKENGYMQYKKGNIELLVMNSAIADTIKENLLRDFCGIDKFKLVNKNITADSKAAALYFDFKERIRFSEDYLSGLLDTKYMAHFFPQREKERLFEKWSK